jgi:membrane protein CcdC involved in cytochrome C biogenesis
MAAGGFPDPILRNPLFWLSRLAVMTAIMLCIIFAAVLTRTAFASRFEQLRKATAREGR